jgi:crotonobetainyl-CoA:carnitine CoA-transferase CaiB-like acyl-CoA transferase
VLERLGVPHEALLAANPRLVVCALTGYGQTGPLAKRAGHDLNYLARAGVLGFQGPKDGPPAVPAVQMADVGGGLWSVIGVLSALAARDKTGKGQVVDVSMLEASMPFAIASFGQGFAGTPARRGDEPLTGGIAPYGTYATKDGRAVALAALEPKFWMAFCAGVGIDAELAALLPGEHQVAIKAKLAAIFAGRTRDEWAAFGAQHDCCLEPVLEPGEVAGDAHVKARGMFFQMDSPWGPIPQMKMPLAGRTEHAAPPKIGEHTDAILKEAGLSDSEIASLRADGAI